MTSIVASIDWSLNSIDGEQANSPDSTMRLVAPRPIHLRRKSLSAPTAHRNWRRHCRFAVSSLRIATTSQPFGRHSVSGGGVYRGIHDKYSGGASSSSSSLSSLSNLFVSLEPPRSPSHPRGRNSSSGGGVHHGVHDPPLSSSASSSHHGRNPQRGA